MPRDESSRRRDEREYDSDRERRRRERRRREREELNDSEREAAREARREARRRDPERQARHEERKRRERRERARGSERERERDRLASGVDSETEEVKEIRRAERRRDREWRRSQQIAQRELEEQQRQSRSRDARARDREYVRDHRRSESSSQPLTFGSAEHLERKRESRHPERRPEPVRKKRPKEYVGDYEKYEVLSDIPRHRSRSKPRRRHVSGALLEEGNGRRLTEMRERGGGGYRHDKYERQASETEISEQEAEKKRKRKKIFVIVGIIILLLAIIIPVAVVLSNKKGGAAEESKSPAADSNVGKPSKGALDDIDPASIPTAAKNTELDPFSWLDTTDFNLTYTDETVGGLPVMGLFSKWDDSAQANKDVPALNKEWGDYAKRPARGVNVGGWLNLEPFITPSFFKRNDLRLGIIDEWTLCEHLGPTMAKKELEQHYATFINEQTFKEIRDAGLDHVRIPFGYWAVETYDNEPFVRRVAWRYLLRAIEWCRKYGLRVNLDPHGVPGSQNGWNHSGRQGDIGWLNGTDGTINAERTLEFHKQMATFFAQPRYKNIIAFYGIVNEPKMTALKAQEVNQWTAKAYSVIREAGITAPLVFGDGFLGHKNWQGQLSGMPGLVLDVHHYVIFNVGQIVFSHQDKVKYACNGWTDQTKQSMDPSIGFGSVMMAEWSQADTDCTQFLNNVGWGSRWEGTYDTGNELTRVLSPQCPTKDGSGPPCDCTKANADPSTYPEPYKKFLKMFAEAQMHSFEYGWGWFYWTWKTEAATQWSYKKGMEVGIIPKDARKREFNCDTEIPAFDDLPENY